MGLSTALCLVFAAAGGSRAHLESQPTAAQIGQPFELTIVVEHPTAAKVKLPEPTALPRSFAFIDDLGTRRQIDTIDPSTTITRATWRVMALEGGEIALPPLDVQLDTGGLAEILRAEGPKVAIDHALHDGEDAPRPARGFRDTPTVGISVWPSALVLLLAVGLPALLITAWFVRRRRRPAPAPRIAPAERLAELERRAEAEPESARAVTYALTALLRSTIDEHAGESRAAMIDADWVRAISADERVPGEARRIAVALLSNAESVKYAGDTPSVLGLRDSFHQVRSALAALATSAQEAA
ncbi:MAG: DUF4381 family protein [Planctomycetes bacterium]|nr:DUF4381 family protein [Planctomycetota bacterium]